MVDTLRGKTICIVDTETNGFPTQGGQILSIAWKVVQDFPNNPYATEIRYVNGRELKCQEIHGITQDILDTQGLSIDEVMDEFEEVLKGVSVVVMHNAQFDCAIIKNERPMLTFTSFCSMRDNTIKKFVDAKNKLGHKKMPSLIEFYTKLFGEPPVNSHNAADDVDTLYQCISTHDNNFQFVPLIRINQCETLPINSHSILDINNETHKC